MVKQNNGIFQDLETVSGDSIVNLRNRKVDARPDHWSFPAVHEASHLSPSSHANHSKTSWIVMAGRALGQAVWVSFSSSSLPGSSKLPWMIPLFLTKDLPVIGSDLKTWYYWHMRSIKPFLIKQRTGCHHKSCLQIHVASNFKSHWFCLLSTIWRFTSRAPCGHTGLCKFTKAIGPWHSVPHLHKLTFKTP